MHENKSAKKLRQEAEVRKEREKIVKAKMEHSAATEAEALGMLDDIKKKVSTRVEYEKIKPKLENKEEIKEA